MSLRPRSFTLMRISGIRVSADLSWFIVLFLLIYLLASPFRDTLHSSSGVAYLTTVISVLLLFASLIVHELGHAFVARREGIEVTQIDLYLFGGLTRMGRDAASPGEDFRVSAAGPLATCLVILVFLGVDMAIVGPHRLTHAIALDNDIQITPVLLALSWLVPMNVILLAFNLLPAFPLDGGRIARSIVWKLTGSRARGTLVASYLGQAIALGIGGFGVYVLISSHSFGGLWALAVAYMIYSSARSTTAQASLDTRIEGVLVSDVMDASPVSIPDDMPLPQAIDEYFLRYGWSWFPALDEHRRFTGIVRQERAQASIDAGEGWLTVASVVDSALTAGWHVRVDGPITDVLSSDSLRALGAVMAVDGDGVLRGVVTIEQVRRVMQSAFPTSR